MKKVINSIGFIAFIVGAGGIAGAIELDESIVKPLLVMAAGVVVLGVSAYREAVNEEDNKRVARYFDTDARPYFLR